jgi:hypothetical protein
MRLVRVTACLVVAAACGRGPAERARFDLTLSGAASKTGGDGVPEMTVVGGDKLVVQVLVVGNVSGPVAFTASGLPPFATLDGNVLTMAPARTDHGTFPLSIEASDGAQTVKTSMRVVAVARETTLNGSFLWADQIAGRPYPILPFSCPSRETCTAYGTPAIEFGVCDDENDEVTLAIEVVPRGSSFQKVPTYSMTLAAGSGALTTDYRSSPPATHYCHSSTLVPMAGLEPDRSYDFALKISVPWGPGKIALSSWYKDVSVEDGWVRSSTFGFDVGPCTTHQCACVVPDGHHECVVDAHCCGGGVCVNPIGPENNGVCVPKP